MNLFVITGACGSGKSTMRDALGGLLDPSRFFCADADEMGLNWWDYAETDRAPLYKSDCLREAVRRAEGRDLVFCSCIHLPDFLADTAVPDEIGTMHCVVLLADNAVIRQRLRDRPPERGFTTEEKIDPHVEFNRWFRRNRSKFPFVIDTGALSPYEAARRIASHILYLAAEPGFAAE